MRTNFIRTLLVAAALLGTSALAADAPALQKISDHVYAYVDVHDASPANSFGANAGLVVGRDAVLVVDTLISAKEAQRFLADIRKVTDKPVKYVVNTHHHLDHAWGNGPFVSQGAVVLAHDFTARDLPQTAERLAHPEASGLNAADMAGTTLVAPSVCFSQRATVDLGDITVELNWPGPTHTPGSITAYIPQDKVLFVGDIIFAHYHPFLADGDLDHWAKALDELAQVDAAKIIPGHGPLSTKADLAEMKAYLHEFDTQARTLCAGKRAEDAPALAEQLLARLPQQQRTELPGLIERNLRMRYLVPPQTQKANPGGAK